MSPLPFSLRRPVLILRGLLANRERPDLTALAGIEDPETFLWEILPHAARTFAPCIALLPGECSRAAAVGYLYCRMLDTYEDLLPDAAERERALLAFAGRLNGAVPAAPPAPLDSPAVGDDRDRGHLLLVERGHLVDAVYADLSPGIRGLIRRLVRDMADGMIEYSRAFATQGGVLTTDEQVAGYCRAVIGHPVVFVLRLLAHVRDGAADLPADRVEDAMQVGEFVQLANITRDIEKDLGRGIAYRPELRADLNGPPAQGREERVRAARQGLLRLAFSRAPAYRRMVAGMTMRRASFSRASAVLMLLYTHRYYGRCARRAGLSGWSVTPNGLGLLLAAFPAFFSRRAAARILTRVEGDFARAGRRGRVRALAPSCGSEQ